MKWGSVDYRVLPPDSPAHVAATKLNTEFGPERSTANMMLATTDRTEVAAYTQKVEQVPGVVDVRPVAQQDGHTLLRATWDGNSQTQASQDAVRAIRAIPGPGRSARPGRRALGRHRRPALVAASRTCRGWR